MIASYFSWPRCQVCLDCKNRLTDMILNVNERQILFCSLTDPLHYGEGCTDKIKENNNEQ